MRYGPILSVSVSCLLAYDAECFQSPPFQAKPISIRAKHDCYNTYMRPYAGSKFYSSSNDESRTQSDKVDKKGEENAMTNLGNFFDNFMSTLTGKEEEGKNRMVDRDEKDTLKIDDVQNPFIERLTSIFDGGDEVRDKIFKEG